VATWFSKEGTISPSVAQLVKIGERGSVSLNWLLLGTPPMLSAAPVHGDHVPSVLRAAIFAELATEFGWSEDGIELSEAILPEPGEMFDHVLNVYRSWAQLLMRKRMSTRAAPTDKKGSGESS